MVKIKKAIIFFIILLILFSTTNTAYADYEGVYSPTEDAHTGEWLYSKYSNIENRELEESHWEGLDSFFKEEEVTGPGEFKSYFFDGFYKTGSYHGLEDTGDPSLIELSDAWTTRNPNNGNLYYYDLPSLPQFTNFYINYEWNKTFIFYGEEIDIKYFRRYMFGPYLRDLFTDVFKYYDMGSCGIWSIYGLINTIPLIAISEDVFFEEFYAVIIEETINLGLGENATIYTLPDGVYYNNSSFFYPTYIAEWVEKYEIIEPTEGNISLNKEPNFVFTKWHKHDDGTPSGMDINISWDTQDNRENNIKESFFVDERYRKMGLDLYPLYPEVPNSDAECLIALEENVIERQNSYNNAYYHFELDHAGTEESVLYIQMRTEEGNIIDIMSKIPINGYFGINISEVPEDVTPVNKIFKKSILDNETFEF